MRGQAVTKRPCPECGVVVESKLADASDGLGVLPYAYQVKKGPEHVRGCRNWTPKENR